MSHPPISLFFGHPLRLRCTLSLSSPAAVLLICRIMLCCGGRIRPFKECAKRSSCKQKSLILMPTTAATTTPPPVVFTTADPLLLQTTSQVKEVKRIVPPSSSAADAASSVIASYACGGTASYRSAARKLNSCAYVTQEGVVYRVTFILPTYVSMSALPLSDNHRLRHRNRQLADCRRPHHNPKSALS